MSVISSTRVSNGSVRVRFFTDGPSKTEQSHREQVNINSIMRRYRQTRMLPEFGGVPRYGDFSSVGSFAEAATQIRDAEALFMKLPAKLRSRFGNDPGKLIDFMSDAGNFDEAVQLGLVEAPAPAAEAVAAEAVVPTESAGQGGAEAPTASGGEAAEA